MASVTSITSITQEGGGMFTKTEIRKALNVVLDVEMDVTPRTAYFSFSSKDYFDIMVYLSRDCVKEGIYTSFQGIKTGKYNGYMELKKSCDNGIRCDVSYPNLDAMLDAVKAVGKEAEA